MPQLSSYEKHFPCEGLVKENLRLTPEETDEVRSIVLSLLHADFRYVEGQHIGIILPDSLLQPGKEHFRLYTIANTPRPNVNGDVDIELCVRRCFSVDKVSGERKPGITSNYLCDAQPGDKITITGPYGDAFMMPQDKRSNLLMIGSGTGIAPFRSFLQHIYEKQPDWEGQVRLYYGNHTGIDRQYQHNIVTDLAEYYDRATFEIYEKLSQQPWKHDNDGELKNILQDNAREIFDLLQHGLTRVYVAGLRKTRNELDAVMTAMAGSELIWREIKTNLLQQQRWEELIHD